MRPDDVTAITGKVGLRAIEFAAELGAAHLILTL
jgi:NADPH:quinone reductase-like Zn-dependent oxidoreductase